eukprot:11222744-Lingulodinium_polyedra.AAC.1
MSKRRKASSTNRYWVRLDQRSQLLIERTLCPQLTQYTWWLGCSVGHLEQSPLYASTHRAQSRRSMWNSRDVGAIAM